MPKRLHFFCRAVVTSTLLLCLPSELALAKFDDSTRYALERCREIDKSNSDPTLDAISFGFCLGLLRGFDQASLYDSLNFKAPYFCYPDGASYIQKVLVWRKFMDDHPEQLHLPPIVTYRSAIDEAFPCARSKAPQSAQ